MHLLQFKNYYDTCSMTKTKIKQYENKHSLHRSNNSIQKISQFNTETIIFIHPQKTHSFCKFTMQRSK